MNPLNVTIGRVLRVASKAEGLGVISRFKDVAGVAWNDPVSMPLLDDEQSDNLTRFHVTWHRDSGFGFVRQGEGDLRLLTMHGATSLRHAPAEFRSCFEIAARDIAIANEFNRDVFKRKQWFLKDNDIKVLPHQDAKAKNIWLHRHIAGGGMKIFYPTDDREIRIWGGIRSSSVIPVIYLKPLFESGAVASFELKEDDVIVFNQNLLHASNDGYRFRAAVDGHQL